jgi:thiol-disulfide isomerase/thioredoxin
MRAHRTAAAAALCLGLLVAGCGDGYGDDDEGDSESGAPAAMAETETETEAEDVVGDDDDGLLSFATRTVEGEQVDASELAGRDVVVWFWSPWCGSCAGEADGVGRVAAELGDDVTFLGIAGNASQDEYEEFLADHDLSAFPQLVDETGEIWLRFGADTIRSSFFFLDDTGETSVSGYGEIDEDELRDRAEALIAS